VGEVRSCIVSNQTRCITDSNFVTAIGSGATAFGTNATVVSRDTNVVTVIPIDIACRLEVSTNNGVSFFTPSGCAVQFIPGTYIVRAIVTNTGSFDLANVTLTGIAGACPPVLQNLGTLDIGQSRTISLCTNTCTTPSSNYFRISVSGEANRAGTNICFTIRLARSSPPRAPAILAFSAKVLLA